MKNIQTVTPKSPPLKQNELLEKGGVGEQGIMKLNKNYSLKNKSEFTFHSKCTEYTTPE